jgi:hypothetical protein
LAPLPLLPHRLKELRMAHRLRRGASIFSGEVLDVLPRERLELRVARHFRLGDPSIEQSQFVQHGIMQLRLDMRQAVEKIREMRAARTLRQNGVSSRSTT